jgi:5-bromo-4-chloroindolyl phosphate hydrolysis protein
MRVNITYSVDLNEIPRRIATLLNEAMIIVTENVLENLSLAENSIHQDVNVNKTLSALDETRKELAVIDSRLSECTNILIGYQKILVEGKGDANDDNEEG